MSRRATRCHDGHFPVKLVQLESLHAAFARVPDPRARNSHHRVATVLTITALAILMGRQRPAEFLRLAQQLNARQREVVSYYRPPGKKSVKPPTVMCSTHSSAASDPQALATVLNTWLQAHHGQLPLALALDGKAVTDRLAQVISLVSQTTGATVPVAPVLAVEKAHDPRAAWRDRTGRSPRQSRCWSHQSRNRPHDCRVGWRVSDPTQRQRRRRARRRRARVGPPGSPFFTNDCDHGRAEYRELTLATVTPGQLGFPHAATVVAVRSEVTDKKTGQARGETRLFACSLERGALPRRQ